MLDKLSGIDPKLIKKEYSGNRLSKVKMKDVYKDFMSNPKSNISSFSGEMEDKTQNPSSDMYEALQRRSYTPYSSSLKSVGEYQRPMSNQNIGGSYLKKRKNG